MTEHSIRGARNIAVYEALLKNGEMSARDIFATMNGTSIGAVHRSLANLERQGVVARNHGTWTLTVNVTVTQEDHTPTVTETVTPAHKPPAKNVQAFNTPRFLSRKIAGMTDVDALRMVREKNIYTLLYGPPGTGKTALARAAFHGDMISMACDENTVPDDLLGQWYPDGNGGYSWSYGPLSIAMMEGKVLFVDDITLASPKALAVLYPAIDGQRQVTVKTHVVDGAPEVIEAQDGFYVIGAHNPGVHGAILTDALASRFTFQVEVDTDLTLASRLGVSAKFVKLASNLYTKRKAGTIGWTPQLRELLAARDIEAALGEEAAVANLVGIVPDDSTREVTVEQAQNVFGFRVVPLAVTK